MSQLPKNFIPNDSGTLESQLKEMMADELQKIKYTSKVKTLADMTVKERKKLELLYNTKIIKPTKIRKKKEK